MMPVFTVPLHESNDCHNPAGPGGGQFCAKTGLPIERGKFALTKGKFSVGGGPWRDTPEEASDAYLAQQAQAEEGRTRRERETEAKARIRAGAVTPEDLRLLTGSGLTVSTTQGAGLLRDLFGLTVRDATRAIRRARLKGTTRSGADLWDFEDAVRLHLGRS